MRNFIKNNKRTIIFFTIILLIVLGIFGYKLYQRYSGEYSSFDLPADYEIKKYEDNQYKVVSTDKLDVYNLYYKDFLKLLLTNPSVAYNKLTDECKLNVYNNNYNTFLKYAKSIDKSVLTSGKIERYSVEKNRIYIIDNTNSSYVFQEDGVWNYTVYLSGRIS